MEGNEQKRMEAQFWFFRVRSTLSLPVVCLTRPSRTRQEAKIRLVICSRRSVLAKHDYATFEFLSSDLLTSMPSEENEPRKSESRNYNSFFIDN